MAPNRKLRYSIVVVWLFTISGILGILMGYESWFLSLTWLHLSIYLFLILWNADFNRKLIYALCIPFGIGMIAEIIGVNTGLIFGVYEYGKNLGPKVYGVPWMIGVNWAILTYCCAALAKKIVDPILVSSILGAVIMVLLDVVMEFSAPRFDFWEFEGGIAPFQNYVGWLVTACIVQFLFQKMVNMFRFTISVHIFIAILVFFSIFILF